METDAAELARIGEDERVFALIQDKMIVFTGPKIRIGYTNFTGHAQMNAEPVGTGKFEEHSLAMCGRSFESGADQFFLHRPGVASTENALSVVHAETNNFLSAPGVPLFAKPFDLGQFRHRPGYGGPGKRSKHL